MKPLPTRKDHQPTIGTEFQNMVATHPTQLLEYVCVPVMTVSPTLQVIGLNDACQATLAHLCGASVEIGTAVACIPLQIETAADNTASLEFYCRQSFSKQPYYLAGHCVGSRQARSMLLKFTPVLDAFSRPQMLHIMIQDFPTDPAVNETDLVQREADDLGESSSPVEKRPEEDFLQTFDAAPVGIAHVSPEGRFLRTNRYLCEMLGYSPEELMQKTYREVTYSADLSTDDGLVQDVLAGKRNSYVLEKRYLSKDGKFVWAYLAVALLRDHANCPRYFISVVSRIHDQKQALADVEESRTRLKTVFDSLNEAVFVFNASGDVVDANRSALRMFGYMHIADACASAAELSRRFEVRTLNSQLLPLSNWPIYRVLRGERVNNVELRVKQVSSGRHWVASFSGARVKDGAGEPMLAVLTVRDVSKRHHAETLLRHSEQRFRTAFDHIPDMAVLYDRDLRIRYANHSMAQATRKPASAMVGKNDSELHGIPLADQRRPLLLAALESACVQQADLEFASPHGTRYITATCVPLLGPKRHVEELMGTSKYLSESGKMWAPRT